MICVRAVECVVVSVSQLWASASMFHTACVILNSLTSFAATVKKSCANVLMIFSNMRVFFFDVVVMLDFGTKTKSDIR